MSKIVKLHTAADTAYDTRNVAWFEALPTEDLTALWGIACVVGASWDDEVYDALDKRGWFDVEVVAPKRDIVADAHARHQAEVRDHIV